MLEYLREFWRFCVFLARRFDDDGCFYRAAALTYTTLLSLVPLLAVSFAALAAFPTFKNISLDIQNFIFNNFVAASGQVIQNYLQQFIAQVSHLSLIGLIFLVLTAVAMLYTIEQAFNTIWRVRRPRRRILALALYWAILTLTPVLVAIGFAFSSYLLSLPLLSHTLVGFSILLLRVTPFILTAIAFSVLYIVVPNCNVPVRNGVIAGILAAALFECAKLGFSLYISLVPTYQLLYGALAAVPIFLIWIYLSWLIILFGAEVSHALTFHQSQPEQPPAGGFIQAFRWIGFFWQAQQKGLGLSLHEIVLQDAGHYNVSPQEQLACLLAAKLVQPTASGRYILSRDLNHFSLAQFYQSLPWKLPQVAEVNSSLDTWQQALTKVLQSAESNLDNQLNVPLAFLYE